jgi:hypothetical protein
LKGAIEALESFPIEFKVHFLNEQFARGVFAYEKVPTKEQLADMFAKALAREDFCRFRDWMGVRAPFSD